LEKYIEKYNLVRPTSLPRLHCSLGYRTPAEVAYGNIGKNSEIVDRGRLVLDNVL